MSGYSQIPCWSHSQIDGPFGITPIWDFFYNPENEIVLERCVEGWLAVSCWLILLFSRWRACFKWAEVVVLKPTSGSGRFLKRCTTPVALNLFNCKPCSIWEKRLIPYEIRWEYWKSRVQYLQQRGRRKWEEIDMRGRIDKRYTREKLSRSKERKKSRKQACS